MFTIKVVLSVAFEKDIADWLVDKRNRSNVVNDAMREYIASRGMNSEENIDRRMAELKQEFNALKLKKEQLIENA